MGCWKVVSVSETQGPGFFQDCKSIVPSKDEELKSQQGFKADFGPVYPLCDMRWEPYACKTGE